MYMLETDTLYMYHENPTSFKSPDFLVKWLDVCSFSMTFELHMTWGSKVIANNTWTSQGPCTLHGTYNMDLSTGDR